MIFRKIVRFKYDKCVYDMFISNNNKRFFLQVDQNGNYNYLSIEKLIELDSLFISDGNIMNATKNKIFNFSPKAFISDILVTVSLATILSGCAGKENVIPSNNTVRTIQTDIAFEVEDQENPLELTYYNQSDQLKYKYVYDSDYANIVFDYDSVSPEMLVEVVNSNSKISQKYKSLLIEFISMITKTYPNADLRIFYENLKSLEVVECESKRDLALHTLAIDSYACYVRTENKIYVANDYEYQKGTWEYQVIMHEFGHALRTLWQERDGYKVKMQVEDPVVKQVSLAEALNSLFVVKAFDYDERDIAYQFQSNYYGTILECIDNYDLTDYVNHSLGYFAQKLDEYTGYVNYATTIFELVDVQYNDYHSDLIEIDPEEYKPIYDYVCDIYFSKYISGDMSYDDALKVVDDLVEKLLYDVPEDYHINKDYFYEYFRRYCEKNALFSMTR